MTIRIAIADDHPAMLAGMEYLLAEQADIFIVGLVRDSTQLVDLLGKHDTDVIVTDFSMPNGHYGDGITLLRFLKRRYPRVKRVVVTGMENPYVLQAILDIGVHVIVSKVDSLDCLDTAIRSAHVGKPYLSPVAAQKVDAITAGLGAAEAMGNLTKRETEVLRMLAEGDSIQGIAARIGRSRKTVSSQKASVMRKLGLLRDGDIFRYAQKYGLIQASQLARDSAVPSDI